MLEMASSRLEVSEPVLNHRQQVLESANESLDPNDGEYEGHDGQSEESEKENELSHHGDDTDHQSAWGAQRPMGREFLSVTGLFVSNENTIGPAVDLPALVLREASRDRR